MSAAGPSAATSSADGADVLGEKVASLLSHNVYEKRKQGANEIERMVRQVVGDKDRSPAERNAQIKRFLDALKRHYIDSQHSNNKKGGLIGLASVAIGLDADAVSHFLPELALPILGLLEDQEPRVKYYACEAFYNIAQVAKEGVLRFFDRIFTGLCDLISVTDEDCRHGARLLRDLLQDVVRKSSEREWRASIDAEEFAHRLGEKMDCKNPGIRQMCLFWLALLIELSYKDERVLLLQHLDKYLEKLFLLLGDQSRETRINAHNCLTELLKGVVGTPPHKPHPKAVDIISDTIGIVIKCCSMPDPPTARLTALCWLHEYVHLQMQHAAQGQPAAPGSERANEKWIQMLPQLLRGTLHCIDDHEEEIARMAVETNQGILEMVQGLQCDFSVDELVKELLQSMQSQARPAGPGMVVRTACLQWICMLLGQRREKMLRRYTLDRLFDPIFETLLHEDDEVVAAALGVLAQIMEGRKAEEETLEDDCGRDLFAAVVDRLLQLFQRERRMLEVKGRLMIRHLCGHLDARRLYVTVARAIQGRAADLEFAQQLVQTFSWILFTAAETKGLREELTSTQVSMELPASASTGAGAGSMPPFGAGRPLFLELLEPWFHNPVSALALCLWAGQYELAMELTTRFAAFEPKLDLLKQLDQMVHLLESPVFARLRLRLLEPRKHPALVKCVLGLAMLLPQAGAFSILKERILVVQSGLLLEAQSAPEAPPAHTLQRSHTRQNSQGENLGGSHMLSWVVGRTQAADSLPESEMDRLLKRFDDMTAAARE